MTCHQLQIDSAPYFLTSRLLLAVVPGILASPYPNTAASSAGNFEQRDREALTGVVYRSENH